MSLKENNKLIMYIELEEETNMFCEKCGAAIEDGSLFCSSCGSKITVDLGATLRGKFFKERHKIWGFTVVIILLVIVTVGVLLNVNKHKKDIFDQFNSRMTKEDVENMLGNPDGITKAGDYCYYEVEFCDMLGTLEVDFSQNVVYWVEWKYYTGDQTVNDYAKETQIMFNHFSDKYGEGKTYIYDNGVMQNGLYFWYEYGTGGARYMLDTSSYTNLIRAWVDYEP